MPDTTAPTTESSEANVDAVVIGAGMTGLMAAWTLTRLVKRVCVLESKSRPGGLVATTHYDGFLLEHGPFTILAKSPAFRRLLEYASQDLEIVTADPRAKARRFVLQHGKLVGIHGRAGPLTTRLYGLGAKARLLRGLLWSRPGPAEETNIFEAVSRRFGTAFATWAVDPLIRGIVTGDCRKLSLQAFFPAAGRHDAQVRSPFLAIVAARRRAAPAGKTLEQLDAIFPPRHCERLAKLRRELISFRDGLAALPTWLASQLDTPVRYATHATSITRSASEYVVTYTCRSSSDSAEAATGTVRAPALIITTPASVTARLLQPLCPDAASPLVSISHASLVVVHLGFESGQLTRLPHGFGFLVPTVEPAEPLLGTLFASRTFSHHAPQGHELLRVFLGQGTDRRLLEETDDQLVARAHDAIAEILGVTGPPVVTHVDRFSETIPLYELGHLERIAELSEKVAPLKGLVLAGSYRDGVSVSDRVAAGFAAALECAGIGEPSQSRNS